MNCIISGSFNWKSPIPGPLTEKGRFELETHKHSLKKQKGSITGRMSTGMPKIILQNLYQIHTALMPVKCVWNDNDSQQSTCIHFAAFKFCCVLNVQLQVYKKKYCIFKWVDMLL